MSFESLLILGAVVVVAAGLALWYFNKDAKSTDLNSDGKTDVNDLAVAVENAVTGVKAAADVNKDGKLDAADVKVVATKAKAAGITKVVFDRNGYKYTGRILALAEAAREAGLEF